MGSRKQYSAEEARICLILCMTTTDAANKIFASRNIDRKTVPRKTLTYWMKSFEIQPDLLSGVLNERFILATNASGKYTPLIIKKAFNDSRPDLVPDEIAAIKSVIETIVDKLIPDKTRPGTATPTPTNPSRRTNDGEGPAASYPDPSHATRNARPSESPRSTTNNSESATTSSTGVHQAVSPELERNQETGHPADGRSTTTEADSILIRIVELVRELIPLLQKLPSLLLIPTIVLSPLFYPTLTNLFRVLIGVLAAPDGVSVHFEHGNGKSGVAVIPPNSESVETFIKNAKRTGWHDKAIPNDAAREGILMLYARTCKELFLKVAGTIKDQPGLVLDELHTVALQKVVRVTDEQLKDLKAFLLRFLNVTLRFDPEFNKTLQSPLGDAPQPVFGFLEFQDEAKKKKADQIHFWNIPMKEELACMLDGALREKTTAYQKEHGCPPAEPRKIDYPGRGGDPGGVTVLFEADHGDIAHRAHVVLETCSPQQKKQSETSQ
jgi:hypothetical protein